MPWSRKGKNVMSNVNGQEESKKVAIIKWEITESSIALLANLEEGIMEPIVLHFHELPEWEGVVLEGLHLQIYQHGLKQKLADSLAAPKGTDMQERLAKLRDLMESLKLGEFSRRKAAVPKKSVAEILRSIEEMPADEAMKQAMRVALGVG